MSKSLSPSVGRFVSRRTLVAASLLAILAGCSDSKPVGSIGYVTGFGGMAAGDEPRSVTAARDILSAGGSAADAAVVLYFTMAVTQPSTASLGGGGVCVAFDKEKKRTEVVDFIAPPSTVASRNPSAVPANVRGFYALQARYGKFRWSQLLAGPEQLARMGTPVSRAFAVDIARGAQLLAADPEARKVFLPGGRPLAEGQMFQQVDLATTLSRIRRSPGDMYAGAMARELVDTVTQAGGSLSMEDLRDLKPELREPLKVEIGDDTAYFPLPPAVGGAVAAEMTAALQGRWSRASDDEKSHLLAETAARAFADRSQWMLPNGWSNGKADGFLTKSHGEGLLADYDPQRHKAVSAARPADAIPAASFVVLDSFGGAVACNVTTYGLFGNGRMAPGTGIMLAAVPGVSSGPAAIGPVLVVNPHSNEVRFAAAASGGVTAPTALVQTLLEVNRADKPLDKALEEPRVHHSGSPDITFAESGDYTLPTAPLTQRGHEVKTVPMPSRVNALWCASGSPSFQKCRVGTDPRGNGLGMVVGKD